MTIFKEIQDLLYNNDCVIIPEFGAFILKSHSAYIQNNNFYPPKKSISFNSMLNENDGLLVKYISTNRNISYKKALKIITDEAQSLNKNLSRFRKIDIELLGSLELNEENNIIFYPNESINFDSNSFGLESFSREPIRKSINDVTPEPKINTIPIFRYAAIFVALIGLSYFGYLNYTNYIDNEKLRNIAVAQDQVLKNIQSATFNLGDLPSINLRVTSPVKNSNKIYYSVIAGSFRSKINAEKHLNYLISKGFRASYTSINPKGLYRVAYARLDSRNKAARLISEIRSTGVDTWLLIEK